MFSFSEFTRPLTDPVIILSLIVVVILVAPLVLSRFKVPGIIGLILAGALVGPKGLNLIQGTDTTLFSTVGLLYLMFLAGLEIDLIDFRKNQRKSIVFGAFTFLIPQTIGTLVGYYGLGFNWASSVLLASMFASHTLLTYPIVSRFGIARHEVVTITVGGTIITDTLALLVLAVIAGAAEGELNMLFWVKLIVSLGIFMGLVLVVIPWIARWFFRNLASESISQYLFVLAVVFFSAMLARLAGVEPIIGAFMAGLALNRLIPHSSPLMNRLEFIGQALFIPFFLIGVGLLVDLRVFFMGSQALIVAGTMTVVALFGKWSAAWATQRIFGYSVPERNIIFGLSNSQAAATLAAVLVGYRLGLLNESVLNGTIVMILITCLISSFVTEAAARRLATTEAERTPPTPEKSERILVPIANPETLDQLVDLAVMIKQPASAEPLYLLSVVLDNSEAAERLVTARKLLEKGRQHAAATENGVQALHRVDFNVASGIIRTAKELLVTQIVIGWNGRVSATERLFGSVLDNVVQKTSQMILVTKLLRPLNTVRKMVVVVPPDAEWEPGFVAWVETLRTICRQTVGKVHLFGTESSLKVIDNRLREEKPSVDTVLRPFDDWENFLILAREVGVEDLLILVNARARTLSYHDYLDRLPRLLSQYFEENSFIIFYPEQQRNTADELTGY
ncbi:Kef-type K+ transport system, membrane component KefB [Catalinimonas alkaloidigena]|uniref:Kef-type K+ transport system, membrane component KefB n=1 Tax=Catalinimonas alkaloidigena TaxID=1075417 RepID=A0A1G9HG35_9BACT|nr:cation:proton antiporter [Catalinimonas alkaloidigena]SDL11443.1 Kef-type K+ transport system, membrane component KefB [Catalinimonas alkaloidigena]